MESHEYFRTETAVLRGHIWLYGKEAEPLDPTSHAPYIQIATFQQRKPAVLCTWGSSSPHLPQAFISSGGWCLLAVVLWSQRQWEGTSWRHLYASISHPPSLPALAILLILTSKVPILTSNVPIPHQRGRVTSWQPLSIQPQLWSPIWAIICFVEPTKKIL